MNLNVQQIRVKAKKIIDREENNRTNSIHKSRDLKTHTLRVMLLTCIAASLAMFVYHILDNSIIYSYLPHAIVISMYSFLYFRLERGCTTERISLAAIILYAFFLSPPAWIVLTLSHPMIIVIICFMFVMTILLFDGKRQKIILLLMVIMLTGMMIYDGFRASQVGFDRLKSFIGQGTGMVLTIVMIVYCVWAFKKKYTEMNMELYKHSITDSLTGAYNARKIKELVEEYLLLYIKENINFSLTIIDMDNFKIVNDTFGHETGDALLQETVQVIEENLREGDILARYGGDEFVILLPGCNSSKAKEVVERLLEKISEIKVENNKGVISFSAGIADANETSEIESDIFKLADKRMYYSKNNGRNKVSISSQS